MESPNVYAEPRHVTDQGQCYFYHTMDVPGIGLVKGPWDLRAGVGEYLGHVDVKGKRVLEVGTASGFLCFHMERQGAEVVGYDLCRDREWDLVPYARYDMERVMANRRAHIDKINNAWWLAHQAHRSNARAVYGTVYEIPAAIGPVDVTTFGSILLHLRDPFRALQMGARLARERVVVTEPLSRWDMMPDPPGRAKFLRKLFRPRVMFLPDPVAAWPQDTWWRLSPELIRRFLHILGFEETETVHHSQLFEGRPTRLFTVVGRRTCGKALGD